MCESTELAKAWAGAHAFQQLLTIAGRTLVAMGFLDSLRSWLRSEAAELADAKAELESDLDRDLTERERRLNETPQEAMERLQQEIEQNQGSFDAIEDRLAHGQAKADAHADFAEIEADIVDAEPIDDDHGA